MNITRNNYEEYFLLYADGELNTIDKQAVLHFVTLHPDLAEELDMLMEAVLDTPPVTMPGKHLLLKPEEWTEENLTPQQQELFLLLDKELPTEQAIALQAEIAKDPGLQKDWSVLQQAQLKAVAIEMPGKESLYRREKDRKPIPIMRVKWLAAAAVVAGLGWYGITAWNIGQVSDKPTVAAVTKDQPGNNNQPVKNTRANAGHSVNGTGTEQTTAGITAQHSNKAVATSPFKALNNKPPQVTNIVKQTTDAEREPTLAYRKSIKQQQVIQSVKGAGIPASTVAVIDTKEINNSFANQQVTQNTALQSPPVNAIVYNEDDADETEYVNIAGARIKKQKLRGVFRNVTRTVSRTFDKSNVAQADVASLR